jgi:hypothetical protein
VKEFYLNKVAIHVANVDDSLEAFKPKMVYSTNGTFLYTFTNFSKSGFYNVSASTVSGNLKGHSWTGFEIERNNPAIFIMSLTYGDKSVYQRTNIVSYESPNGKKWNIGWGDKAIPISGTVTNISANYSSPMNKLIQIQAMQNDRKICETFVRTDKNGKFNSLFYPP